MSSSAPESSGAGGDSSRLTQFDTPVIIEAVASETPEDVTLPKPQGDIALNSWMKRPVQIYTRNLIDGEGKFQAYIDPWHLYLTNTNITPKLRGFAAFRGSLVIRVEFSISPYQYGAYMVSYKPNTFQSWFTGNGPAQQSDERGDFSGGCATLVPYGGQTIGIDMREWQGTMARSTRPRMLMLPQDGQAHQMTLPYMFPQPWYPLRPTIFSPGTTATTGLGNLCIESIVPLAKTTTNFQAANIRIFAWLEDAELGLPSAILQSGKPRAGAPKHEPGVVEKYSKMGAQVANVLSDVPVIGPLASTAQGILGTVGKVASWFGWTPMPNTSAPLSVCNKALTQLAIAEEGPMSELLAVDKGCALTIDPRTVGAPGVDEMTYSYINSKKCILGTALWEPSRAAGSVFASFNVTPLYMTGAYQASNAAGTGPVGLPSAYDIMQFSPAAHLAVLHRRWRGSITYTFTFIASAFHRGKARIFYDPVIAGADNEVLQRNHVIDISECTTYVFKTPWDSVNAWKEVRDPSAGTFHINQDMYPQASAKDPLDQIYHSGELRLEVFQELSAPIFTANVWVMVEVSCEGVEYSVPIGPPNGANSLVGDLYYLQSGPPRGVVGTSAPIDPTDVVTTDYAEALPPVNLVTTGEVLTSVRSLLRRETLWYTALSAALTGTATNTETRFTFPRVPTVRGTPYASTVTATAQTTWGPYTAVIPKALGTAKTYPYNAVGNTYMGWMAGCYTGQRGAVNYRFAINGPVNTNLSVARHVGPSIVRGVHLVTSTVSSLASLLGARFNTLRGSTSLALSSAQGLALATKNDGAVSVTIPSQSDLHMLPANPTWFGAAPCIAPLAAVGINDGVSNDGVTMVLGTPGSTNNSIQYADIYVSAGGDYQLFNYLNPPLYYERTATGNFAGLVFNVAETP